MPPFRSISPLALLLPSLALACGSPEADTDSQSSSSSSSSPPPTMTEPNPTVTEGSPGCEIPPYELHVSRLMAEEAVDFVAVAGLNAHKALALAADGRLFRANESAVFQALSLPAEPGLRGVEMADPDTWMAVGDGGLALRTVDYGESWAPVDVGTQAALHDIVFFNYADPNTNATSLRGVIVGEGVILRSVDAGASWEPVAVAPELAGPLRAVGGAKRLLAAGEAGLLIESVDAGETWARVESGTSEDLTRVVFGHEGPVIISAAGSVVDGGSEGSFWPSTPSSPAVSVGRVDLGLVVLHRNGEVSLWPESWMMAEPKPVGAGAQAMSRGNMAGALVAGEKGLVAFVSRTINEGCPGDI